MRSAKRAVFGKGFEPSSQLQMAGLSVGQEVELKEADPVGLTGPERVEYPMKDASMNPSVVGVEPDPEIASVENIEC